MFWQSELYDTLSLSDTLAKPDVTVEQVLDDEFVLQELRNDKADLLEFLCRPNVLHYLFDLALSCPSGENENKTLYRYAHLSHQVLSMRDCSRTLSIAILSDEDCVRRVLYYLRPDGERTRTPLQDSFFKEIVETLLYRLPVQLVAKLRLGATAKVTFPEEDDEEPGNVSNATSGAATPKNSFASTYTPTKQSVARMRVAKTEFIADLLRNLHSPGCVELLRSIAITNNPSFLGEDIKMWLTTECVAAHLVAAITSADSSLVTRVAASDVWCELLRELRQQQFARNDDLDEVADDALLASLRDPTTLHELLVTALGCPDAIEPAVSVMLTLCVMHHVPHSAMELALAGSNHKVVASSASLNLLGFAEGNTEILERFAYADKTDAPQKRRGRVTLVRLLSALLNVEFGKAHQTLLELGTMPKLLNWFDEFPTYNLLHCEIVKLVAVVLYSQLRPEDNVANGAEQQQPDPLASPLVSHLLRDTTLLELCLRVGDENSRSTHTRPAIANLWHLANFFLAAVSSGPNAKHIEEVLRDIGKIGQWNTFVADKLEGYRKQTQEDQSAAACDPGGLASRANEKIANLNLELAARRSANKHVLDAIERLPDAAPLDGSDPLSMDIDEMLTACDGTGGSAQADFEALCAGGRGSPPLNRSEDNAIGLMSDRFAKIPVNFDGSPTSGGRLKECKCDRGASTSADALNLSDERPVCYSCTCADDSRGSEPGQPAWSKDNAWPDDAGEPVAHSSPQADADSSKRHSNSSSDDEFAAFSDARVSTGSATCGTGSNVGDSWADFDAFSPRKRCAESDELPQDDWPVTVGFAASMVANKSELQQSLVESPPDFSSPKNTPQSLTTRSARSSESPRS